ncbi:MAG: thioredoxin domain-containing protein [Moraxellaceae bacterium]|nr:thioredoxin domain-containing protein [Moraxellaceae bacterium]MDZ4385740.1 thioredoxin domain-containing protein [Moraxellaceae bacterium]
MKNTIISFFVCFWALLATPAFALEKEPFTEQRFAELQAENQVILVDVFADWCSTCKKQQEVLQAYRQANPDKLFHILTVDFDTDKQQVRALRAPRQSTLLLYKGDKQYWFSVAETRAEVISAEINKVFAAK